MSGEINPKAPTNRLVPPVRRDDPANVANRQVTGETQASGSTSPSGTPDGYRRASQRPEAATLSSQVAAAMAASRQAGGPPVDTGKTWAALGALNDQKGIDRNFGHRTVDGQLFGEHGTWADTGTAVSADQLAAMTDRQVAKFGQTMGLVLDKTSVGGEPSASSISDPETGSPPQGVAAHEPTVPSKPTPAAQPVDEGKTWEHLGQLKDQLGIERDFGHERVDGQLFGEHGVWADAGTALSADQLAAMTDDQVEAFGQSMGLVLEKPDVGGDGAASTVPDPH